jgi:hypothetical protein
MITDKNNTQILALFTVLKFAVAWPMETIELMRW